jgi:hypothetical protein
LSKNIARYFSPISLERARAAISLLMIKDHDVHIEQIPYDCIRAEETTNHLTDQGYFIQ